MIDNQDSSDEIQTISRRLQTVTTIDNNIASTHQRHHNQNHNHHHHHHHSNHHHHQPQQSGTNQTNLQNIYSVTNTSSNMTNKSLIANNLKDVQKFDDVEIPVRNLPELNVPEKIVLIIDITKESNCTKFKLGTGATYMPMFMIKRVVEIFIGAKSMIKRNHEFALMTLTRDSIEWICDFTYNIKTILNHLDSLTEESIEEEDYDTFDLGKVFEILHANVDLQKNIESNDTPTYITRAVLIYCRSNCIPRFCTSRKYFDILSEHPYFVLDSIFVHEPPSDDNKCEEVYTELSALDAKNFSYILEVGRNATKLHDNMAKLLAHPLQRPLQRNALYNITAPGNEMEEIQTNV